MKTIRFIGMAILAIFMSVNLVSCSSGDDEEVILDPSNDYGKISKNDFVATGGYRNLKPLRATILASINTVFQGAYTSMGVEFTPNQPNFGSSETKSVKSKSGVTNGHFETELAWDDEGALEPGTTYYYRAYVYVAGTRYNGETRSFDTPDIQLSKGDFVDLGLSVKWASYNMGANSPEAIGTCLQQEYAFDFFDRDNYIKGSLDDDNWLGDPDFDVATYTMGGKYRIPAEDEWRELENSCNWTSGVCNGVKGFYVSDKRDGTAVIFLPYVKKSNEHDITVYLSAPDDIISIFTEVEELDTDFFINIRSTPLEYREEYEKQYTKCRLELVKKMGAGEVLTEKYHHYCDYGLVLYSHNPYYKDYSWTHPITGKAYNFYKSDVLGGGVLYVRAVSNR